MRSNMYTNLNNDLSKREEHLHNGTVMTAYQFRLPIQYPEGREKMIIRRYFNSFVSMHQCDICKQVFVPLNIARIAHYRCPLLNIKGVYEFSATLANKTFLLQQELHQLFD